MRDLGMLVYHQIFDMDILTDGAVCKNYTVLDNSALFDGTATAMQRTATFSWIPTK